MTYLGTDLIDIDFACMFVCINVCLFVLFAVCVGLNLSHCQKLY
jgi:hypothetical protein